MLRTVLFPPMFSAILNDRKLSSIICGTTLLQLLLTLTNFPGWPCPIFHTLGIPCPGCGLTRATLLFVRGDLRQAFIMHAFAPLALLALILIACCAIMPRAYAERIAGGTEVLERYTGITALILSGLILYWLARLLIMQGAFVRLIQN